MATISGSSGTNSLGGLGAGDSTRGDQLGGSGRRSSGAPGSGQGGGKKPTLNPKPKTSPLPEIPDQNFNTPPMQVDLSPISEAPSRRPVRSALGSFTGSAGITGLAGVFVP